MKWCILKTFFKGGLGVCPLENFDFYRYEKPSKEWKIEGKSHFPRTKNVNMECWNLRLFQTLNIFLQIHAFLRLSRMRKNPVYNKPSESTQIPVAFGINAVLQVMLCRYINLKILLKIQKPKIVSLKIQKSFILIPKNPKILNFWPYFP